MDERVQLQISKFWRVHKNVIIRFSSTNYIIVQLIISILTEWSIKLKNSWCLIKFYKINLNYVINKFSKSTIII